MLVECEVGLFREMGSKLLSLRTQRVAINVAMCPATGGRLYRLQM